MASNTIKHQQVINYIKDIIHHIKNSNMPISSVLEILVGINAMEVKPFAIS